MMPELITPIPGPRSQELAERLKQFECRNTTFTSEDWPVFWEKADGVNVWDADGNRFLDLTSAFGVATLGHGATAAVLCNQAQHLVHAMGDVHPARLKAELCERLSAITFGRWNGKSGRTLLGNSGFEAVEAALKTAALKTQRHGIVAFDGAYHGLGYGALLGAGIPWFRQPFEAQLAPLTHRLPFPCEKSHASVLAFRDALETLDGSEMSAVLVEPIQGRGGIVVPHESFLAELRRWCDRHGALLIIDEIYTGFHRTGFFFACDATGVIPDLICLGKALTGGFPLSACVGSADVMDAWPETRGEALHTSTFLGNPLGCAMAIESIRRHLDPSTVIRAATAADHLAAELQSLVEIPIVHQIRGRGLMKGIELRHPNGDPAGDIAVLAITALLKDGLILLPDGPEGHVLALTPALTISSGEIAHAVRLIANFLKSV